MGASTSPSGGLSQLQVQALIEAAVPYKVYTALLTQSGTDAPVATVLQNTLGGTVVWSYSAEGSYIATLAGAFTVNKTFCIATIGGVVDPVADGIILSASRGDVDTINLSSYRSSDGALKDMHVTKTFFEIHVYT